MNLGIEFVELDKTIHDRSSFDCGENNLNIFIKKQASKHMQVGISKTMILPDITNLNNNKFKICAFYTIAPSSIKRESLPAKLAKSYLIILFQCFYWHKWLSTLITKEKDLGKSLK